MEKIIKIGNVELYESEAMQYYQENKYIVTYSHIYQLFYSAAQKTVYGNSIYHCKGMTKRGRFYVFDGKEVNRLVKADLVKVD